MLICAGIDGGQSSSTAVAGDENGNVIGTITGPALDLVGEPAGSRRRADLIDQLLANLRRAAHLPLDRPFDAVVGALSGFDPEAPGAPAPSEPHVRLLHDSEGAHAGALGGAQGCVVIAGTGSVALAIDGGGRRARSGGWGYFFGDEGSAVWIAREAIREAMRRSDRGEVFVLGRAAESFFGLDSLRAIQHAFAHGAIDRAHLARFGQAVIERAPADHAADRIVEASSDALAELAATACARAALRDPRISYAGGVFSNPGFAARFADAVRARIRGARVSAPIHGPAVGALLLAYRDAGVAARITEGS